MAKVPQEIHIGLVKYIDYQKEWMSEGNLFFPVLYKRKSFEHEREVRAIFAEWKLTDDEIDYTAPSEPGYYVPVALSTIIQDVYVAPTAPDWIFDLVKSITDRYLPAIPVHKSSLDDDPVF